MADYVLEAELRERTGGRTGRRLRRQGKVPGIVYGGGKEPTPIALPGTLLAKLLADEHFHATIIELKLPKAKAKVILKDAQLDPVTDEPVHVDFQRVRASERIHITLPVVAVNHEKCPGIVRGGVLEVVRHELEVVCRADSIPEHIEVDCSELDIGDVVHVEDLALPKGVEVPHEVNFTVLTIAAPTVTAEQEAAMEGEGEEEAAEEAGE